jgi:putative MFS transporter
MQNAMQPQTVTRMTVAELNARIDRLPTWGLSKMVFVVVGFAYFFAFYDISAIAFTLPELSKLFHLSGNQIAYPVTANLLGYLVGAYALGNIADYLGRRQALLLTVIVLAVGGLLTAMSWGLWSLSIFRFITGLGMGAEIALAATIVTEFSPSRLRGRYTQVNYCWGAVGLAVTPFVAVALLNLGNPAVGWRFVFGFGALVAIMLAFMRGQWLPESPRWLVIHGRAADAEALVTAMEARCRARTGQELPAIPQVPAEESYHGFPTMALFKPPYLGRMVIIFGFWSLWYVTVYGYLGFEPTILIKKGTSIPSGLLYSALGDLAIPIGAVIALLLVDLVRRNYYMAAVAVIFAIALAVMALSSGGVALFLGAFFSAMMIAANSVGYVYTAELFPTRARATATSIGDGLGHIGGVVAPFIVTASLASLGGNGTLWLLAVFVLVSGAIILLGGIRIRTNYAGLTEIAS